MIVATQLEKVKAARVAFQAWERAIEAAQCVANEGVVHGLGATVMTENVDIWKTGTNVFKCSECSKEGRADHWNFCAYCGAEI